LDFKELGVFCSEKKSIKGVFRLEFNNADSSIFHDKKETLVSGTCIPVLDMKLKRGSVCFGQFSR